METMGEDYFDDPEFQELIQQYLDYLRETLPELKADLEKRNFPAVRKYGHNVKGSGGGYGFDNLTELGKALEQAAIDEDFERCGRYIQELEDFLAQQ
jgi:HPt (histidine-containing phosphotransfer) domain-containing protein